MSKNGFVQCYILRHKYRTTARRQSSGSQRHVWQQLQQSDTSIYEQSCARSNISKHVRSLRSTFFSYDKLNITFISPGNNKQRQLLWRRYFQHSAGRSEELESPNEKLPIGEISQSSKSSSARTPSTPRDASSHKQVKPPQPSPSPHNSIRNRLPHLHYLHRPTKEELLSAATGFWARLKVRFKWATIRSARPFNMDEIGAVFSWILLGHFVWIIIGTTTFFSLAILFVNTVFAQETLARWIGNYLTKSSGLRVVFESAIVPKWSNGVISFKRVFVLRRPGQGISNVSKGSQSTAAAAAAASSAARTNDADGNEEDTNYTQFDLSIDSVDVTLSFAKWFNGKGLLKDVEVNGVRGVIDRTSLQNSSKDVDPRSYRHHHHTGDFELDSFKLEDLLVTVHQPGNFRPFPVSVYSCELPRLRQQWLFYDFLCANNVSGSFDDSLFAIHPRQVHGITGARLHDGVETGKDIEWKKHSRIRIDSLNIDHLNRGVAGPFSWIYEGNVDIVADVMIPPESDDSIAKVMSDVYDRVEATVTNGQRRNGDGAEEDVDIEDTKNGSNVADERYVVCDVRVQLNDVRAAVPLFTYDISYVNNAMIRPIVAYINSRRTFIPINCRVVERVSNFDGSWTIYDSGLLTDLSREVRSYLHDTISMADGDNYTDYNS